LRLEREDAPSISRYQGERQASSIVSHLQSWPNISIRWTLGLESPFSLQVTAQQYSPAKAFSPSLKESSFSTTTLLLPNKITGFLHQNTLTMQFQYLVLAIFAAFVAAAPAPAPAPAPPPQDNSYPGANDHTEKNDCPFSSSSPGQNNYPGSNNNYPQAA
jgi:hypothetical protein